MARPTGNTKRSSGARPSAKAQAGAPVKPVASGGTGYSGMDVFDKVVWYCLHLLLVLVPLAMTNLTFLGIGNGLPLTYDQFDIAKVFVMRALTIVALGAWAWKLLMSGGRIRRTKVDWLIVAFLAWVVLTTVFSVHWPTAFFGKYRRFEGLISFANYAAIFFLTVQMVDRPSRIRSLARTLFIGGSLVAIYGLMQSVGIDPIKWGNLPFEAQRSFSTYGNPDLLGGYLMFPLPIALGLALSEENEIWRWVYWFGFSVLMVGVWITEVVRGAWIGGMVAFAAIVVAVVLSGYRPKWLDWGGLGVSLVNIAFLVVRSMSSRGVLNVAERVQSITQTSEGSAATRFEIWGAAVNAIKARPLVGWGADTFRLVFPRFKPLAYTKDAGYLSVADNVHDYPLQLASALGIFGFLLLYGVLGLVVWLSASMLSPIRGAVLGSLSAVGVVLVVLAFGACIAGLYILRERPGQQQYVAWAFLGVFGYVLYLSAPQCFVRGRGRERLLLAAFWAAALGYIVHLFFGLSVTGSTFLLWFSFGILLSPLATAREVEAPSWGSFGTIASLGLLSFFFIYNAVYLVGDNYYLKARVSQGDAATRIGYVKSAISLNPFNDMYRAELGLAYQDLMIAWLSQAQSQTGTTQAQSISQGRQAFLDAETALKETIAFVPTEYDNYVFLTNLYNQGGVYFDATYFDKAITLAKKAEADIEPNGPAVRFQEGLAYQYKGDFKNAITTLVTASRQDPSYVEVKMLLGDIYRRQRDWANARLWYQEAAKVSSGSQKKQVESALQAVEASAKAGAETTPAKK